MASTRLIISRGISTSSIAHGMKNFRHLQFYNKRGNRAFKEAQRKNPRSDVPIDRRGGRPVGLLDEKNRFTVVPEMIPELIVPDLTGCELKPYVSYRVNIEQRKFTAKDLFNIVYAPKIKADFAKGELGPNGEPLNPSEYEKLTPEEAKANAEKTGTDIFQVKRTMKEKFKA